MMTSWNGTIFRVTGPLCGARDAGLWCFLWSAREAGDLRRYRVHFDVTVMYVANIKELLLLYKELYTIIVLHHEYLYWGNGINSLKSSDAYMRQ